MTGVGQTRSGRWPEEKDDFNGMEEEEQVYGDRNE